MEDVTIYTDGSARGNPNGPGGYGAILKYVAPSGKCHIREYSNGYKKTTNKDFRKKELSKKQAFIKNAVMPSSQHTPVKAVKNPVTEA